MGLYIIDISGNPIKECILVKKRNGYISEDIVIVFGHAMDSERNCSEKIESEDSSAGANAGSREDMAPLSELVWSPDTGLMLKCTNFHFPEKKAINLPSTRETETITILHPQTIETKKGNHNASLVEGNLSSMPMTSKSDDGICVVKPSRSTVRIMPVCQISGQCRYFENEDDQSAGNKKRMCPSKGTDMILPEKDTILGPDIGESTLPLSSALEEPKPNFEAIEAKCVELNGETWYKAFEKSENGKPFQSSLPISISSNCKDAIPPSVNDKDSEKNKDPKLEASHDECRSPICYDKEGREVNSLSDVHVGIGESKKDDSHESVESSNSGRLFSTAKRAWNFEQQQIVEHKKAKKLNNESPVLASFLKQDSSFFSWIFNMTNRLSKSTPDESSLFTSVKSCHDEQGNHNFLLGSDDTRHGDCGNRGMGFQTMFKAMCSPSLGLHSKKERDLEQQVGAESLKELAAVNNGLGDHDISSDNIAEEKPKTNIWDGSHSFKNPSPSNVERAPKAGFVNQNKSSNLVSNRSSSFENLWIARFLPKVSAPILKDLPCGQDTSAAPETSVEHQVDDTGSKLKSCSIDPVDTSGSKKSIVNIDEKLQDKLNHILPSERSLGNHDLSIPQKKDEELLDNQKAMASVYAQKVDKIYRGGSSRKGKELMTHAQSSNELTEMVNFNCGLMGSSPVKNDLILGDNCFRESAGTKRGCSGFCEDDSKENQISPYNTINRQVQDASKGIFEIVRKLRLSRAHVLRWMKSPYSSFHFEGFFLRLRLGKWEEKLGGTGYHVACIIGQCQERSCGSCRFPLFVKLRGVKCLVDSRYVSNHDFTEEELMAWWSAALRGDDKLPSEEELTSKLQEKQKWSI